MRSPTLLAGNASRNTSATESRACRYPTASLQRPLVADLWGKSPPGASSRPLTQRPSTSCDNVDRCCQQRAVTLRRTLRGIERIGTTTLDPSACT
jgi:hypothetical protein